MSRERDEIRALLGANVEALARELAPEGRRQGAYWMAKSPLRADKNAGSFWVALRAPYAWRDEAAGEGGDLLQLVQRARDLPDFPGVLDWCRKWLGLAEWKPGERAAKVRAASEQTAAADAGEAERLAADRKRIVQMFKAAKIRPFVDGPADRYLLSRGIDVRALGRQPGVLGWLPEARHGETNTAWPVMVAMVQHCVTRESLAVHRTFLRPDGRGKAPVSPARKIWPSFKGGVIRLWRGGSGLAEDVAAKHGLRETLIIGEGVEDGLSAALAMPEARVWAACTLGNVAEIVVPECCDQVIVMRDNDWGKPQAEIAFARGLSNLLRQRHNVRIASSHIGKDANDALRGEVG